MDILIRGGRVIDPANNIDGINDIFISEGVIESIGHQINKKADRIIDAQNKIVMPGFIDLHVHLREPGFERKSTIASETRAAAAGGYTTICCMPNTNPVADNEIIVEYIKMKAEREGVVNVLPIGAITKGQNGELLADIGKMAKSGICAVSEDGKSVENAGLMKNALKYASMFKLPVFDHCEDLKLVGKGCMNAGKRAALLGLNGISNDSEEVIVARDIILAGSVKARLHICHISTRGSVEILRFAKSKGVNVTAEVTPHHFTLSEDDMIEYDSNFKMNPPLRTKKDVEALKEALKDGTIEAIATDHAPHHTDDKNCEFEMAANGIIGLETAFALGYTELVEGKWLKLPELVEKMSLNPARILSSSKGTLGIGKPADITIADINEKYEIDVESFVSKAKNSPFGGRKVRGKIIYTIVGGKIVFER